MDRNSQGERQLDIPDSLPTDRHVQALGPTAIRREVLRLFAGVSLTVSINTRRVAFLYAGSKAVATWNDERFTGGTAKRRYLANDSAQRVPDHLQPDRQRIGERIAGYGQGKHILFAGENCRGCVEFEGRKCAHVRSNRNAVHPDVGFAVNRAEAKLDLLAGPIGGGLKAQPYPAAWRGLTLKPCRVHSPGTWMADHPVSGPPFQNSGAGSGLNSHVPFRSSRACATPATVSGIGESREKRATDRRLFNLNVGRQWGRALLSVKNAGGPQHADKRAARYLPGRRK